MSGDMIIAGIGVAGGLAIGAISVAVSVPWAMKEKMAKLEARTRERLALIEKGIDPDKIFKERKGAGQDPLFWGFLLAGIGFGIFFGYAFSKFKGWDEKVLINAAAIFAGGMGMILYHIYRKRSKDQRSL
jgi:hypothetical protein